MRQEEGAAATLTHVRSRLSRTAVLVGFAVLVAVGVGLGLAFASRGGGQKAAIVGTQLDRQTPAIPLLNEDGRKVTLADFRGKVVVLSPILTLCHEVCPLTTGAFISMERAVREAGLGDRVVFAEVSVDPWRDSPARLRAFARYTGIDFTLLTGTRQNLRRFWRFFGVDYFRTPQGKPPESDWWTHKPLTFDVAHTDGLVLLDQRGHWRILILGMPNVHGKLAARLRGLLSEKGLKNLAEPEAPWTVSQALADLSFLVGRPIKPV
jgi:cytochrome oxidase Cu insertion factor (SCO1/SenC/PrrC family)